MGGPVAGLSDKALRDNQVGKVDVDVLGFGIYLAVYIVAEGIGEVGVDGL